MSQEADLLSHELEEMSFIEKGVNKYLDDMVSIWQEQNPDSYVDEVGLHCGNGFDVNVLLCLTSKPGDP